MWGWSFGDQSTVTVHVRRLREKVEPDPTRPVRLQTVWGVGYRWEARHVSADQVQILLVAAGCAVGVGVVGLARRLADPPAARSVWQLAARRWSSPSARCSSASSPSPG